MKNTQFMARFTRFGMIAILAVTALLTVAHAQNLPAAAPAIQFENLHPGNGAVVSTDGIRPPWSNCWNTVHPTNCASFWSGGYNFLYIYVSGGAFFTTDERFQLVIAPACQTGNWLAFFVTDGVNWSQVKTYTYK